MTDFGELFRMAEADQKTLYEAFSLNTERFVTKTGARDYKLNDDAFADAVLDIEQDLQIISYRRLKNVGTTGISPGKVAGIYAFRLSRAPILHFCPVKTQIHGRYDTAANTLIALKTALDVIKVSVSMIDPSLFRELVFNLRKRHMNQETLALVIDSLLVARPARP